MGSLWNINSVTFSLGSNLSGCISLYKECIWDILKCIELLMKRSSLRKYVTIKYFTSKLMVKLCKMKAHFHVQVILICQFKLLQIITSLLKFLSFKYVQFCYGKQTDCSTTFQTKMTVKNKNKDTKTKI